MENVTNGSKEVVVRRNRQIFDEISPFTDPAKPMRLVAINKDLTYADVVYASPREFVWDLLYPGQEFSEYAWKEQVESRVSGLFQKLSNGEKFDEDDPKMMAHALNLVLEELGGKYLIVPFWIDLPDFMPLGCEGDLPQYEDLEKYSGFIVADKNAFAKAFFNCDTWNEDDHIDRALTLAYSAFNDYYSFINNDLWEVEFVEDGKVVNREIGHGFKAEKALKDVRMDILGDKALKDFVKLIDENDFTLK